MAKTNTPDERPKVAPHQPAAFINALAEEGTKEAAIEYLQKQWNENCQLRRELAEANKRADARAREACTFEGRTGCSFRSAEGPHGLRPDVIAFAKAMQFKLDKNARKKGWPEEDEHGDRGWKSCDAGFLEDKLLEEVGELQQALEGSDLEAIRNEAADIGNIAMMLADNAGALPHAAPSSEVAPADCSECRRLNNRLAKIDAALDELGAPKAEEAHGLSMELSRVGRIKRVASAVFATRDTDPWLPMLTAPLDGTEVQLMVRHFDYFLELKLNGKESADGVYQGSVIGKWIGHNGGGWTWRGHAGVPVAWKPIGRVDRTGPQR